jgi:hypothetical protein
MTFKAKLLSGIFILFGCVAGAFVGRWIAIHFPLGH